MHESTENNLEIERKFLLGGLPEICSTHPSSVIRQGYIPGESIAERLRRIETNDQIRYFRTIKLGTGVKRFEFEDEIDKNLFDRLWPATQGCQISKRRYFIPDPQSQLTWEIDAFNHLQLFLAEIELPHTNMAFVVPDFLAPYIVREVTNDNAFTNLALAQKTQDFSP